VARPRQPKPLDAAGLFDYALRTLTGRALTQGELRTRLARRAADPADVEPAIARLKEYGYLNDRRFAETYARLRLENQGFGRFRVLRDLKTRRVAPQLAEKVVTDAYRQVDEGALIQEYLARKLRRQSPADLTPSRFASLYRSLLRAGFSAAGIRKALERRSVPEEWLEGLESADSPGDS
jgi:regulatory protein